MIPKKLHYCWLSGEEKTEKIIKCFESWGRMLPDYELRLWDAGNFDLNSNLFVSEACSVGQWAFASDYIRLWAIYNEGGIYLDTDVFVRKSFDEFLKYDFFSSVEYHQHVIDRENSVQHLDDFRSRKKGSANVPGIGIQAAVMGSVKGNRFVRDCMEFYENRHFIMSDNSYYNKIIAPDIYARIAERYGFKYKNKKQELENNMMIFPSDIFASSYKLSSDSSYAIHLCSGSWRSRPQRSLLRKGLGKIKNYVLNYFSKDISGYGKLFRHTG